MVRFICGRSHKERLAWAHFGQCSLPVNCFKGQIEVPFFKVLVSVVFKMEDVTVGMYSVQCL